MKFVKYIFVLLTIVLSGCLRDNNELCPPGGSGKIILQLSMPGMAATRASIHNWATWEYALAREDMYVLVFNDKGGDGSNDTFMYYTQPVEELAHPDNPTTRRYSITLRKSADSSEKQRLVFLGNCTAEVQALLADPALTTKTKQELFAGLQIEAKKWGTQFPIPMWGESQRSVIVTYSTTGGDFGNIDMLFAVARVDVAVNAYNNFTEADGLDNFILMTSELRNVRSKGYVVPQAAAQFDGAVVKYPSVVPASEGNVINAIGNFAIGNSVAPYTLSMAGLLFMNEADNKNSTNDKRAFLLVGGYYTESGQPRNTTVETYYRIDFYERGNPEQTTVKYLDILRGHRYMVNITGVDGPGYQTPEEAASSVTTKLIAEVIPWNNEGVPGDITGKYTLTVTPPELSFNWMPRGNSDTGNKVDVFTDYSKGWKVTRITDVTSGTETANTWLATDITAGDPYVTTRLSVNVSEYGSATPRYGRIYIEAGKWTYIINVEQVAAPPELPAVIPDPVLPLSPTYVGAFWDADKTGERLITIPITAPSNAGGWAVQVFEYGDFKEGDIIFSTSATSDTGVTRNAATEIHTDPDAGGYMVTGANAFAMGSAELNGNIYFRIGLKTKWSSQSGYNAVTKPARYAVIVLSYANNTKYQKMYLRQGGGADYLMRPGDAGEGVGTRNLTAKFSSYNLTAADFKNGATDQSILLTPKGGVMTAYPTQAGALFVIGGMNNLLYAFNPVNPVNGKPLNWDYQKLNVFRASYEGCPEGYRRPTGGAGSDTPDRVELLQSLWVNPPISSNSNVSNSVFGRYADGFFDRKAIGTQAAQIGAVTNSAVDLGKVTVAYHGRLFYNPYNGASLFFPAAGWREQYNGYLANTGGNGRYWTSTGGNGLHTSDSQASRLYGIDDGCGMPVRCVAE